ncbi:MAG: carbohydrate kinase FGGY [Gammaproteobacteria bacterium]|nr:MAG: carbohydrate kinase FGGY [Gammaproteobacteria bacterium]TND06899.1 MAG: carbohydrate kinase FGGY [Gammaproteobacteria bacterium]
MNLYVGIDLGTSGCRAIAIDATGTEHARSAVAFPEPLRRGPEVEQDPDIWWQATCAVIRGLVSQNPDACIAGIAVDGTSGTLLLADDRGNPLGRALMYNDARSQPEAAVIASCAPAESGAHGASSSLAKLLWLQRRGDTGRARYALHQADWIGGRLAGVYGVCDYNNALKLGYDAVQLAWPDWLRTLPIRQQLLPDVVAPGDTIATVDATVADALSLSREARVIAGTTDSVAAFCATGAVDIGDAVTSLGSTLVLKILAQSPVYAPEYGVYSHRFGDRWLVGGASNSGGAVLRQYFSDARMAALSDQIHPETPTGLDYYPLPATGERFPVADPALEARVTPRPADDALFFQGLLEGIARIESAGYRQLAALSAPFPRTLRSVGTGSKNARWTTLRRIMLGVPFVPARHSEAAYGAALIARNGCTGRAGFAMDTLSGQ